jgi:lysophospholipase L1-like esterase
MPVFDLVTTDDNTETIANILQRVIGDTAPNIAADVASVAAGGPTPTLLINGVSNGQTIPDNMLAMYQQFYAQSVSIPPSTGISYSDSLTAGGWAPYDGQGS